MASIYTNHLILTIGSLLLLLFTIIPLTSAGGAAGQRKKSSSSNVAVEGVVYCLSCKYAGSGSLIDAKPIQSATVSVTCKNSGFYKTNQTDQNGYFYTWLQGSSKMDNPMQACTVKLVSSPLANCNVATNLNGGLDGAKLRFEGKVVKNPRQAVYYAAGPFAFRPEMCAN